MSKFTSEEIDLLVEPYFQDPENDCFTDGYFETMGDWLNAVKKARQLFSNTFGSAE